MKTLVMILVLSTLSFASAYAGSKDEAKKQIAELNQKLQEAGEKGDLQTAIDAAENALEISKKEFGEDSPETAKALNNVANLYLYADHPSDAERLYKEAILIEVEKYGRDSTEIANSYYNLAMAYAIQKKYEEGRKMLTHAHKIFLKAFGPDHADTKKARAALDQIWNETTVSVPV